MANNDVQSIPIQFTLYDYRLDGPAIREPNLEIDDQTLIRIFLVELSSATCCISVLSKITVRGYRSMPMVMVITFPGNYCVGEGNTINKSISVSLYLLNASVVV
jgi:hypothetical protein